MLNENIVSLLIPCYNGEQFVERCLINVLEQEYAQYIELILVNDGSTDKTEEIIFQLQKRLDNELWRFCYIKWENQGVGSAMNAALKEVSGEYLTSLDIDDLMTKDCISKKVSWLKANPSYALVRSNGYFLFPNQEKRLFYAEDYKASEDVFLDILNGRIYNWAGSYMIRTKKFLEKIPSREIYPSRYGQNLQLLLPAAYQNEGGYISSPLMMYYIHSESMTHQEDKSGEKRWNYTYGFQDIYMHVIEEICKENQKSSIYEKMIKATFSRQRMELAIELKDKNLCKRAYKELKDTKLQTEQDRIRMYMFVSPIKGIILRIIRKLGEK